MANISHVSFIFVFSAVLTGCATAQEIQIRVTAANPLPITRSHETIVVRWNDIAHAASGLKADGIEVIDPAGQAAVVSQLVDDSQNGTNAEFVFQSDFKPNESKQFIIRPFQGKREAAPAVTDARFMTPREDVAWENDRNAFRIYGPALAKDVNNGIDVWCKRVRYPVIEKWYKGDEGTGSKRIPYHEDHGEGADFFDVGRTLGAGGDALVQGDSLLQPGVFASHRIIATGPIRAMFETTYPPVRYDGKTVTEVRRITLDAGSNLNRIDVLFKSDQSDKKISFVAGLVLRKNVVATSDTADGWTALWGPTNADPQNGSLGTGIVMPRPTFAEITQTGVHILVHGNLDFGTAATYYAGACWTRSGDIAGTGEWNAYLADFARRIASPIAVTVEAVK